MNFIFTLIGTILGKLFNRFERKTEISEDNTSISETTNTTAMADGIAAIIWVCAIVLGIYWILQYGMASYFFVKDSLRAGHVVAFQINTQKLFDMIYSFLGIGAAGFAHKIAMRLLKR